jgi:hypothetical protein
MRAKNMDGRIDKLIEIIEFLVDVDCGIKEQHAKWIYEMLNELKEYN